MPKPKKNDSEGAARHRGSSKPKAATKSADETPPAPMSRLEMEQQMAQLGKLLKEQEFESVDEINDFLSNLMAEQGGVLPRGKAETPLEKAQEIVFQAIQEENPRKAIRLAEKAIKTSPDCVDAYLLLADLQAETLPEAFKFVQKALDAGKRILDPEIFENEKGHFWLIPETRPYMRAQLQMANMLWQLGDPDSAIQHYQELLELNPGDNQGVRYILLNALLQVYRNEEAAALIDAYEDDAFAAWAYDRALLSFRLHGRSPEADAALAAALEANEFVPDYLLGDAEMPFDEDMPELHGWGDESEAILYAMQAMILWAQTPGAHVWMTEQVDSLE